MMLYEKLRQLENNHQPIKVGADNAA